MFMTDEDNMAIPETKVSDLVVVTPNNNVTLETDNTANKDECWEVEETVYHENCPYKNDLTVIFKKDDYAKILAINNAFPDNEFSVYFNVIKEQDGRLLVTEIIVPKQEVGPCSVDYKEHIRSDGVLHKHPNGIAGFSAVDEKYINANHNISLLFINGKVGLGTARIQTPCKCLMKVGVKVLIRNPANPEMDNFIKEVEQKITKYEYKNNCVNNGQFSGNYKGEDYGTANNDLKKNGQDSLQSSVAGVARCTMCNKTIYTERKVRHCIECEAVLCKQCFSITKGLCECCIEENCDAEKQLFKMQRY